MKCALRFLPGALALLALLFCGVAEAGPRKARSAVSSKKGLPFSGDINADGKVNKKDRDCLKKFVKPVSRKARSKRKSKPRCMKVPTGHADMNCDGRIGHKDVVIIDKIAKGAVKALKGISPFYKKRGDTFLHQGCLDKYLHMPATAETWLSYFNTPGEILYGAKAPKFTHRDLVAATVISKDLASLLNDDETSQLKALQKAFNPKLPDYSKAAVMGSIKPNINYVGLAQQASDLLHAVLYRALKTIEFDGPDLRLLLRSGIVSILHGTYAPELFMHYLAVSSGCPHRVEGAENPDPYASSTPGTRLHARRTQQNSGPRWSSFEHCKDKKTGVLNDLIQSSLVRQQLLAAGYKSYDLKIIGEYIVSQQSPIAAALHLGLASSVEAEFYAALGLDLTEGFDAVKANELVQKLLPGLGKKMSNVGTAPASCVEVNGPGAADAQGTFGLGVLGRCGAGEPPSAPPGLSPGAGPDPDPTAMAAVDPGFQEVPSFLDHQNPCYGIDGGKLFGHSSIPAGWYLHHGKDHGRLTTLSDEDIKSMVLTGASAGRAVLTTIILHTPVGKAIKATMPSLSVGGQAAVAGTVAVVESSTVEAVESGVYDIAGETPSEAPGDTTPPAGSGGSSTSTGIYAAPDSNGNMHRHKVADTASGRAAAATEAAKLRLKQIREALGKIRDALPNEENMNMLPIGPRKHTPNPREHQADACAKSAAQDLLGCMFPSGGNGDEMGSTSQCDDVCMVAGASATECGGAPTFMACGCADKPGGGKAINGGGGQSQGPGALRGSGSGDCPGVCAHRFVAEILGDVDCSNCPAGDSSPTNLAGFCGQGMIPPGLMKLCGAIDPVGQAGQPARIRKTPALNKNRATRTQMNRQQRNRRTRQTPASSRGNP